MTEVWKDIEGYEGYYQVSNQGRVRSLDRVVNGQNYSERNIIGKTLAFERNSNGYKRVGLLKGGIRKRKFVHRLVIETFLSKSDLKCVNHIDGNKNNNLIENLEYVDHTENLIHAYDKGLREKGFTVTTKELVDYIRDNKNTLTVDKIIERFKCSKSTAYRYFMKEAKQ